MQPYLFHPKKNWRKPHCFFLCCSSELHTFELLLVFSSCRVILAQPPACCSIKPFSFPSTVIEACLSTAVLFSKLPSMCATQRNSLISKWYGFGKEFDEKHSMITSISWLNKLIYYVCASRCFEIKTIGSKLNIGSGFWIEIRFKLLANEVPRTWASFDDHRFL